MRKIRKKLPANDQGIDKYEFFGGTDRQEDIDFFAFYQQIASKIPNIGAGIRKILAHKGSTATEERSFNVSGNVINMRRCSLNSDRAEKLSLSAIRYKTKLRNSNQKLPRIVSLSWCF